MKRLLIAAAVAVMALATTGCDSDARVASENLSTAADNFQIDRRIVFYDSIQGSYLLSIEGRCSIEVDASKSKLDVTCKTAPGQYKKHFLGISSNVTWFAEQMESAGVSTYRYKVVFKPTVIIPDITVPTK